MAVIYQNSSTDAKTRGNEHCGQNQRKEAVDDVCAAMSKLAVIFCFGSATDWYKYIYGWYHCTVVKTSMEQHKPDVTCVCLSAQLKPINQINHFCNTADTIVVVFCES